MQITAQGFVATVNHLLAGSPWAIERLLPFSGKTFRIDATPIVLDAAVGRDGLIEVSVAPPDVTLSLPFSELPAVATRGVGGLMSHVHVAGNVEFAEALGFVFRNLSWDVEEDLSRLLGDIPAHRLVGVARALHANGLRGLEGLAGNLGEYLTEEGRLVASQGELEGFYREVAELRDAVARLGKRVERLERKGGVAQVRRHTPHA